MFDRGKIVELVAGVYDWLDGQLAADGGIVGECGMCGECCDFEKYGHRLYVSTPEMIYFQQNTEGAIKRMDGGWCPYNVVGKCSVYGQRFAGCRLFGCKGDGEAQRRLSEECLGKFKGICEEYGVPYRYKELSIFFNEGVF
ncbi:MAG: hypothetical protein H8D47_00760 [Planctomycetes bacterium]|nr:hypothetical protein [Planctomycetota bacterium]